MTLDEWSEIQALASQAGAHITRRADGFTVRRDSIYDINQPWRYAEEHRITVTAQVRPDVDRGEDYWRGNTIAYFDRLLTHKILWRTKALADRLPFGWGYNGAVISTSCHLSLKRTRWSWHRQHRRDFRQQTFIPI